MPLIMQLPAENVLQPSFRKQGVCESLSTYLHLSKQPAYCPRYWMQQVIEDFLTSALYLPCKTHVYDLRAHFTCWKL